MAKKQKVEFSAPVERISGKVVKKSNRSHRTLYGTNHIYGWNPENVIRKTHGRLIHREAMGEANHRASAELKDAVMGAKWRQEWTRDGKRMPVNAFVIKQLLPEIKAQLTQEWKDKPLEELEQYVKLQAAKRFRAKLQTASGESACQA